MRQRRRTSPEDPAVVVYAGRITAEKGLAVVIEALGATQHDAPVELRIAGVIEDHRYWLHCQRLQAAAMARSPDLTITYLGHLDYDATDEQFRQSDIVAVPSQWPDLSAPSPSKRCPLAPPSSHRVSADSTTRSSMTTTGFTPIPATSTRG